MNRKNNFLPLVFSLLMLFVCGLLLSACGSSVNMSSVKSAEDIEREKNVTQYKPEPKPATKKEEPKPTSKEPTRKTTETKPNSTTSTPEPKRVETSADVPSFSRVAPESRFKFTGKQKVNKEQGKYTSSEYYTSYKYNDFGNFSNDGWYNDSSGVAEKFVNLLITSYPFKLSGHFVNDRTGSDGTNYAENTFYEETWRLDYTGSKNIKKHWVYDKDMNEVFGHIFVVRNNKIGSNSGISREYRISISDGLTYEDSEKNPSASAPTSPSSGGGSSFDYPSGPELKPTEITDVACARCSGLGYVEEFTYDTSTPHYDGSPPPAGVTIRKPCPVCGGSGRKSLNW